MNPEVITNARTLAHTLSDGSVKRALRQLADSLEETRELEADRDHWHANAMKAAARVKWMRSLAAPYANPDCLCARCAVLCLIVTGSPIEASEAVT